MSAPQPVLTRRYAIPILVCRNQPVKNLLTVTMLWFGLPMIAL